MARARRYKKLNEDRPHEIVLRATKTNGLSGMDAAEGGDGQHLKDWFPAEKERTADIRKGRSA
jgi:hypothetical protein